MKVKYDSSLKLCQCITTLSSRAEMPTIRTNELHFPNKIVLSPTSASLVGIDKEMNYSQRRKFVMESVLTPFHANDLSC